MDNLSLYMVTYNVATKSPSEDVSSLLKLRNRSVKDKWPDFYCIGLQEVRSQPQDMLIDAFFSDPWTNTFRDALALHDYIKVKTIRLQGIVLSLYTLRKHVKHLRDIETQYTRTGFGRMWGNKGAVSIRFNIYGCSICIVNSHLTPHDHLLKERISDHDIIVSSQTFTVGETTRIFHHDYVMWLGDLNFRLENADSLTAEDILSLVNRGQLSALLDKDQLCQAMTLGTAFGEMTEQRPDFPPTYKFHLDMPGYDLKRRPAWTDRILYFVNRNVYENVTLETKLLSYRSVSEYKTSDHKPVVGEFLVKVFSDYHDRLVEFSPPINWFVDESNVAVCRLGDDVETSAFDWVGVFKENFKSLDEYLCYVYVDSAKVSDTASGSSSRVLALQFPETTCLFPGNYCLIYFTSNALSVLGQSPIFQIAPSRRLMAKARNNDVTRFHETTI